MSVGGPPARDRGQSKRPSGTTGIVVRRGGDYDRWDLEVRGGTLGAARLLMSNEDYPGGKQQLRFRIRPLCPAGVQLLTLLFVALSLWAALDQAWVACVVLGGVAGLVVLRTLKECAVASAAAIGVLRKLDEDERDVSRWQTRGLPLYEPNPQLSSWRWPPVGLSQLGSGVTRARLRGNLA